MAVLKKTDLLAKVKEIVGDDTSDSVLNFLGDLDDTLSDLEKKSSGETEWKTKYEENDKAWRERYRDRFMQGSDKKDEIEPNGDNGGNSSEGQNNLKETYEELFS